MKARGQIDLDEPKRAVGPRRAVWAVLFIIFATTISIVASGY
jgi:hypothetical protein